MSDLPPISKSNTKRLEAQRGPCNVCFFVAWEPTEEGIRCGHCWLQERLTALRAESAQTIAGLEADLAEQSEANVFLEAKLAAAEARLTEMREAIELAADNLCRIARDCLLATAEGANIKEDGDAER